ncbi:MAG: Hsp20/alpha crystallin family protein [Clostridium sp.]|nr:Hsp20/alpha crystallin family protein [Clostridium sp.]
MYLPSIFDDNLVDRWMDDFDREFFGKKNPLYGHNAANLMKTDVREQDNGYEIDVDLPGMKKEDIQLTLENGVLSIAAGKDLNKDEKDEKTGRVIRQERYSGRMSRSFYVGDNVTENDITAKMENGVLSLVIPKKAPQLPEKKTIAISD